MLSFIKFNLNDSQPLLIKNNTPTAKKQTKTISTVERQLDKDIEYVQFKAFWLRVNKKTAVVKCPAKKLIFFQLYLFIPFANIQSCTFFVDWLRCLKKRATAVQLKDITIGLHALQRAI